MKRIYNTQKPKDNKIIITIDKKPKRNKLHFQVCKNSNVAYISKDKSKIIPRKQKYKKSIDNYY